MILQPSESFAFCAHWCSDTMAAAVTNGELRTAKTPGSGAWSFSSPNVLSCSWDT